MATPDDADALRRLQLLFREQVARAAEPGAQDPGASDAAAALRAAIREEVTRRLDERLKRLRELQARAYSMPHEEVMAQYAELVGTACASPQDIIKGMLDWVARAVPDSEMRDRVFAQVLNKMKSRPGSD